MESSFSFLNSGFFTKAEVYPGSLGTFRYRFKREGWIGSGRIQAWVYENTCFELAEHIETETFDWTEEGVEASLPQCAASPAAEGCPVFTIPLEEKKAPS